MLPALCLLAASSWLVGLPRAPAAWRSASPTCQLSSGLTFTDDAGQRLVSLQRPLGLVLEQAEDESAVEEVSDDREEAADDRGVLVAEVGAGSNAERAGVNAGDVLLAVNNLDVSSASLDAVMLAIQNAPGRVVNLRFQQPRSSPRRAPDASMLARDEQGRGHAFAQRAARVRPPTMLASWSDASWQWGSASGAAHVEAARLRKELSTAAAREAFERSVADGSTSFEDAKLALALLCQRASKQCFAAKHGLKDAEARDQWRNLMQEMAQCRFEGPRGDVVLVEAIGERLGLVESARLNSLCALSAPRAAVVSALKAMAFVEAGI